MNARPLGELIALEAADGFEVVETSPNRVTMERRNSWFAVLFGAIIAGLAGGNPFAYRHERIYLHVEDGRAVVRLQP